MVQWVDTFWIIVESGKVYIYLPWHRNSGILVHLKLTSREVAAKHPTIGELVLRSVFQHGGHWRVQLGQLGVLLTFVHTEGWKKLEHNRCQCTPSNRPFLAQRQKELPYVTLLSYLGHLNSPQLTATRLAKPPRIIWRLLWHHAPPPALGRGACITGSHSGRRSKVEASDEMLTVEELSCDLRLIHLLYIYSSLASLSQQHLTRLQLGQGDTKDIQYLSISIQGNPIELVAN